MFQASRLWTLLNHHPRTCEQHAIAQGEPLEAKDKISEIYVHLSYLFPENTSMASCITSNQL
jgi:hypothetical protein